METQQCAGMRQLGCALAYGVCMCYRQTARLADKALSDRLVAHPLEQIHGQSNGQDLGATGLCLRKQSGSAVRAIHPSCVRSARATQSAHCPRPTIGEQSARNVVGTSLKCYPCWHSRPKQHAPSIRHGKVLQRLVSPLQVACLRPLGTPLVLDAQWVGCKVNSKAQVQQ